MARESRPAARRGFPPGPSERAPGGRLGRWPFGPGRPEGRGRWSEWARALSERHGRVAGRHGFLNLVLARQRPPLRLLRQHWLTTSRWFQPLLRLTIQPLLRRETWREQVRLLPGAAREERPATPPLDARRLAPSPADGPVSFLQLRSMLERWAGERAAEGRPAGASASTPLGRGDAPAPTPLQMVFRRASGEDLFARPARPAAALEAGAQTLLRRIAQQSRRVEERAPAPASLVLRRQEAAVTPAFERTVAECQSAHAEDAAPRGGSAPQGAVNIEQITDQVMRQLDRRVVAARERMGRV